MSRKVTEILGSVTLCLLLCVCFGLCVYFESNIAVLSAKVGKSAVYRKYTSGPKTLPCVTQDLMTNRSVFVYHPGNI